MAQARRHPLTRPPRDPRVRGGHPRDRRPLPRRPRDFGPDDARLIRYAAEKDRRLLPRRQVNHPGGVHSRAPEGAYSRLVCWNSRETFLNVDLPILIGLHRDVLRRHGLDPDTFRYGMRLWTLYGDQQGTGRHVIVRPSTVARLAQIGLSTFHRVRRVAEEIGVYSIIQPGRMLSVDEVVRCRDNGSKQRGLSNEGGFHLPRSWGRLLALLVGSGTPTRGTQDSFPMQVSGTEGFIARGAKTRNAAASPRPSPTTRARRPRRWGGRGGRELATKLLQRVVWLANSPSGRFDHAGRPVPTAAGHLAPQLAKFERHGWLAGDVMAVMDAKTRRLDWDSPTRSQIRISGPAMLRWFLDDVDPVNDHPRLHDLLAADRGRADRQARAAQRRAAAQRVAGRTVAYDLHRAAARAAWRAAERPRPHQDRP
jgi:hypothetical protein